MDNCFLYRMPLKRLALVVRGLPVVRDNLLSGLAPSVDAAGPQYVAAPPSEHSEGGGIVGGSSCSSLGVAAAGGGGGGAGQGRGPSP